MIDIDETTTTREVLINTGFYNFKGENGVIFKTAIQKCSLGEMASSGDVITLDNESYIVGRGEPSVSTDKTSNNVTKLCVLNMICRQLKDTDDNVDRGGDFNLYVTSPPIVYAKQKKELPNYLKGEYKIKYKGQERIINIKNVLVFPETILAQLSLRVNQQMCDDVIIIDIGGVTTTVARFVDGNCGENDILSIPYGMHNVNNDVINALQNDYSSTGILYNIKDMTKFLTQGVTIPNTSINILEAAKKEISEVYTSLLNKIDKKMQLSQWGSTSDYQVVMTGGGSIILYDIAKEKFFKNAILSNNPLFDNLKGLEIIKALRRYNK